VTKTPNFVIFRLWHVIAKEGPADYIRIDEVPAALKKMKRDEVPGLSG